MQEYLHFTLIILKTARRVSKDENLTDLDKSGQCFVMEHHQKV